MPTQTDAPKIEVKTVKHTFNDKELNEIGADLARAINAKGGVESELEKMKAEYKAKIASADARIETLTNQRVNGFEHRNERCAVKYRYKDRKKDYYLEKEFEEKNSKAEIVLTEDMTDDDFALELFQAESRFDMRKELPLFPATESDRGVIVIGRLGKMWHTALRIKVGKLELNERLDSEQASFKKRPDAVERAGKKAIEWFKKNLKVGADGFEPGVKAIVDANKDLEE